MNDNFLKEIADSLFLDQTPAAKEHRCLFRLIEYIPQAIPRARKLGNCDPTNNSNYPHKIGTTVYKLLEKILTECNNL